MKPKLGTIWQEEATWTDCPGEFGNRIGRIALWQIYDVADTDEEVTAMFIARYGREPAEVWRDGGCVHAGPITKAEHDGKLERPGAV